MADKTVAPRSNNRPAKAASVTPEIVKRVGFVLGDVMAELRALRCVAEESFGNVDPDALPTLAIAICERSHVLLDHCARRLGQPVQGSYSADELFEAQEPGETEVPNG